MFEIELLSGPLAPVSRRDRPGDAPQKFGSQLTPRWREPDSNSRSRDDTRRPCRVGSPGADYFSLPRNQAGAVLNRSRVARDRRFESSFPARTQSASPNLPRSQRPCPLLIFARFSTTYRSDCRTWTRSLSQSSRGDSGRTPPCRPGPDPGSIRTSRLPRVHAAIRQAG